LAQNTRPSNYFKPKKLAAMREIRRLVIAGTSHQDIQRQLGLSERSYYRYLQDCFKEDRERLAQSVTTDELLTQVAIVEERLMSMYRNLREMATNKDLEPSDRISAEQTAGEVSAVIMRLWTETPTKIMSQVSTELPRIETIISRQIRKSFDRDGRIQYLLKKEKEREEEEKKKLGEETVKRYHNTERKEEKI
jgi:hypothetical protein